MAGVAVSPEILKWAARRARKEDSIHLQFKNWSKWISKETQPTLKQLEHVSKATATPLGFFFLTKPPIEKLPIPHYRTMGNSQTNGPSPDLIETVQTMERRQQWMRDYLVHRGNQPLDFVGKAAKGVDERLIASAIRKKLGLSNGWASSCSTWQEALRMLLQRIESIGILVVVNGVVGNNTHRKLDVAEFRGFVLVDEYAPLVFVNGSDGKAAQMFSLAHELAHVWYGASAIFDLQKLHPADDEMERACNAVAAEFLVPEKELTGMWSAFTGSTELFQLAARHFKVSELVVARRSLDLRLISKDEFFDFYERRLVIEAQGSQSSAGGNFYATQNYRVGRRFAEAVIKATLEGKILYREAYSLTGLKGKTFTEYAARLGLGEGV
ncbi:MAG: ImmA/IrrE family metallo-endopeptidase [Thermaerobacter sp.]|nr:ImmA/IrrE family metallo-endopeptidase [Thermaerobacter sp.]